MRDPVAPLKSLKDEFVNISWDTDQPPSPAKILAVVDEGTLSLLRRDANDPGSILARGLLKVLFSPEELEGSHVMAENPMHIKIWPQKEALDVKQVNAILENFELVRRLGARDIRLRDTQALLS
ncbi:hypothetical protein MTO96_044998 [Rhipicephalus appendiculatus]